MSDIHLLVLVHGMWGFPAQLGELARIARETHAADNKESASGAILRVHVAESVEDQPTYDGVDWCAEHVAKEIMDMVKEIEAAGDKVTRFSLTGFSLGGLIARYCIGILYQHKFFENIEPVNFTAISAPHCGLPRYPSWFSWLKATLGPILMSRTGQQFYCVDRWSQTGRPLLEVMADPDYIFYQALTQFKHLRIYANAVNDITVPYATSAVELEDPFADYRRNGLEIEVEDALIKSYTLPDVPPPKPSIFSGAWFKTLKPSPPPVPLPGFPTNIVIYALIAILVPFLFTYIIIRFLLACRKSRARIRLLEKEASGTDSKTLMYLVEKLEKKLDVTVVSEEVKRDASSRFASETMKKTHPIITPTHRRIAEWLNTLPWKKELAFFPGVLNSHNIIVCRDVAKMKWQRPGEVVIRHWAKSLEV